MVDAFRRCEFPPRDSAFTDSIDTFIGFDLDKEEIPSTSPYRQRFYIRNFHFYPFLI